MDEKEFNTVINILEEKENIKINSSCSKEYFKFTSPDTLTELGLKIYNNSLIIQKIYLINRRQGIFSQLLKELIKICIKNGLNQIVIQSVKTEEMQLFCEKNNFKLSPFSFKIGGLRGDYYLNLNGYEGNIYGIEI